MREEAAKKAKRRKVVVQSSVIVGIVAVPAASICLMVLPLVVSNSSQFGHW